MLLSAVSIGAQSPAESRPRGKVRTGVEGVVRDSTGAPVANATLTVRSTGAVDDTLTRPAPVVSDGRGRFRILGLTQGDHVLEVVREEFEPAGFRFSISTGVVAQLAITLLKDPEFAELRRVADSLARAERAEALAGQDSTVTATGLLQGRVVRLRSGPVANVSVQVLGTPFEAQTDSTGRFRFPSLPVGPVFLRVRKLGFEPVMFSTVVVPGDSLTAEITMTPFLTASGQLDTVRVRADGPRTRRMQEFERRRRWASGTFIDRKEIELRQPSFVSDLLRGRAHLTIARDPQSGETLLFGRNLSIMNGQCQLAMFVDGFLMRNMPVDAYIPPNQIEAIEVYAAGSRVPGEFARPVDTDCGAILIWTRQ